MEDPRQERLLVTREERLSALKAIDPESLGVGRRRWATVVDLLTQIEVRTCRDGCFCYVGTLAAAMAAGAGVHRATMERAAKVARELLLLSSLGRTSPRGDKLSSEWRIHWDRIRVLARQAGWKPPPDVAAEKTATTPSQTATRYPQTATFPNRNNSSTVSLVEDESTVESTRETVEENLSRRLAGSQPPPAAWGNLAEIEDKVWLLRRKLGPTRSPQRDWQNAVKWVRLSQTVYSEAWLWGPAAAAATKNKPWAWLQSTLAERAAKQGRNFWRDLAQLTIPAELVKPNLQRLQQELAEVNR